MTIADAVPDDLPFCRSLLPHAFPTLGRLPEFLIVRVGEEPVGCAAVSWRSGGFPLTIAVAQPFRRRGYGSALFDAILAQVSGETRALRSWDPIEEESTAAAFCDSLGFEDGQRFLYWETDARPFAEKMGRLLDRIRDRIPPSVRVVSLTDAPSDNVAALVSSTLGVVSHHVAQRLDPDNHNAYDPVMSRVVMIGERAIGAILCRQTAQDSLEVEVNVVDPAYRGGWCNLQLLEAMARHSLTHGIRHHLFGCEPHVRDTINAARRSGATPLPDRVARVRLLG